MTFLTLEDYNSINFKPINEYYELNTQDISEQEFTNVLFDFCIVSHEIDGNEHTFSFQIQNSLWAGGYWFSKQNGDYIDTYVEYDWADNSLTITTNESSIILNLYLCSFAPRFRQYQIEYKLLNLETNVFPVDKLNTIKEFVFLNLKTGDTYTSRNGLKNGVIEWQSEN